jgi:hypothetical protein
MTWYSDSTNVITGSAGKRPLNCAALSFRYSPEMSTGT